MATRNRLCAALAAIFCVGLLACSNDNGTQAPPVEINEHTKSCLITADRADEKEDKVIRKCPSCGLGMSGDAKHASNLEGYEIHSCSASCKKSVMSDANKVFAAIECPPAAK